MNADSLRIAFVGGGNMASALIGGMIARGTSPQRVSVIEPSSAQRDSLAQRFPGLQLFAEASAPAIADADVVVLAVKPQQMRAAAKPLAAYIDHVTVVVTVAAGIRIDDLSRWLNGYRRIVRVMPNTPALIGAGIAGLYAPLEVDSRARGVAETVLRAAGDVVWCDREDALDAITGISGSGPAYVFYFIEALEQAARDLGFAPDDARRLAYATFSGAVALAKKSDASVATLRAQVTSKGGTTERAIATLERDRVKKTIIEAVKAAAARAKELGDELGRDVQ